MPMRQLSHQLIGSRSSQLKPPLSLPTPSPLQQNFSSQPDRTVPLMISHSKMHAYSPTSMISDALWGQKFQRSPHATRLTLASSQLARIQGSNQGYMASACRTAATRGRDSLAGSCMASYSRNCLKTFGGLLPGGQMGRRARCRRWTWLKVCFHYCFPRQDKVPGVVLRKTQTVRRPGGSLCSGGPKALTK